MIMFIWKAYSVYIHVSSLINANFLPYLAIPDIQENICQILDIYLLYLKLCELYF